MEVLQQNKDNIAKKVKTDYPTAAKSAINKPKATTTGGKKSFVKTDKPKNPLGNVKFNNGKKK